MNIRIEEPFYIFNYDFQLRFSYYNYQKKGMFWYTNQIKSLKKILSFMKKEPGKPELFIMMLNKDKEGKGMILRKIRIFSEGYVVFLGNDVYKAFYFLSLLLIYLILRVFEFVCVPLF
ncbi:hypothetical protein [Candidatus Phytoplasma sacchari]